MEPRSASSICMRSRRYAADGGSSSLTGRPSRSHAVLARLLVRLRNCSSTSGGSSGARTSSSRATPARDALVISAAYCNASSAVLGPRRPSRRINHGSVRLWSREPATTANAISRSRSRAGVSGGSRNAAASVTTPRIPAQDTTAAARHDHACAGATTL